MADDEESTRTLAPNQPRDHEVGDGDELPPGTMLGAYAVQSTVAAGGGGTVYSARHNLLGRTAAVKVLRREMASSPQALARFLREARVVNMIRHPNIVDIYEFGELPDGRPYFVMELLEGVDLRTLIQKRGRLGPREVVEILEPVCSALEAAHAQGIVHRDLKASNIRIGTGADGRSMVKLIDFGVAKLLNPDPEAPGLTAIGTRLGTAYAMAPEQIRSDTIDERADIYALGVLLYHMLTGHYPFRSDRRMEIERMHLETAPPRPSQSAPAPPALDAVVLRCMEKKPELRYRNVSEFLEALRQAVGPLSGERVGRGESTAKAVAVYVELRTDASGDDGSGDPDEALLEDSAEILDIAEQRLREAGFTLPLQTGSAVLGARILSEEPEQERSERLKAIELARELVEQLTKRRTPHPNVHVNVCLHADNAVVRGSPNAPEIAGGDIVSVSSWAPEDNVSGIFTTPEARAGLGLEDSGRVRG